MTSRERVAQLVEVLPEVYPGAHCELDFRNPLELLVATILSAQCTDKRVNLVTPALFKKYRTVKDYAAARSETLEGLIRSTGFFRSKTKSIRAAAAAIVAKHAGRVPDTMEKLHGLPGVGRKTANVVLGNAFGKDEGIVVDTHVVRLSHRLRLTRQHRSGKNRTRSDETRPAQALDELEPLAHLARAAALFCEAAGLPPMRDLALVPQRAGFHSQRRSAPAGNR